MLELVPKRSLLFTTLLCMCAVSTSACKKDEASEKDTATILKAVPVAKEVRTEDGLIMATFDDNNDGLSEITKYFEEVPDPDDPADTIRRIKRMEFDVNSDGKINVVRYYDSLGALQSEHIDQNLDGKIDVISYYAKGDLTRKELLKKDSDAVELTRYYANEKLLRVEKDTTGDGKIDYWEYYEQGVLDRIGRDFNADGRADSWQAR